MKAKAKKDLKRYRQDLSKMRELFNILQALASGEKLDIRYRPHMLSGKYKDCMECHVGNDFLLIWIDSEAIYVERIGSHSEYLGDNSHSLKDSREHNIESIFAEACANGQYGASSSKGSDGEGFYHFGQGGI